MSERYASYCNAFLFNCILFGLTGRELTDKKVSALSKRITDHEQLRTLAIEGLTLPATKVQTCLTDEEKIGDAAHKVLTGWLVSKPDRKIAYDEMCRALDKVDLKMYIAEVLEIN